MYADRLNNSYLVDVKEAENGDNLYPGRVLIAPGEHQMRLKKRGNTYYVECFRGNKVSGHCPSVDVLFSSVAEVAAKNAIGIILTGMGSDGSRGLLEMRQKGARTIGQDEKSCVVYGMPKVAMKLVQLKNRYLWIKYHRLYNGCWRDEEVFNGGMFTYK